MADIFISYSRTDRDYVDKLRVELDSYGLEAWWDSHISTGDRWLATIEREIRQCRAMILIMSPDARESEWVEREIMVAEREKKRIFPLLLNGECFMAVINRQYEDVTSGALPPEGFFKNLRAYLGLRVKPEFAKDIMQSNIPTLEDKETVHQVTLALLRSKTTVAAILRDGTFLSLISLVELVSFMADYFGKTLPADILISQLLPDMPQPLAIGSDTPVSIVRDYMMRHKLQYLPIFDERNHLVGIVSERDIALINK